jgi:hypothetical protein
LPNDRGKLQTELKRRVKQIGASATAGLGSVFVPLGDRWLKTDGRLASVLPAALASGEAWGDPRKLIADRYHLEIVISSHDAERPAGKKAPGRTTYISFWRNPRSIHEALDLANRITQGPSGKLGEITSSPPVTGTENWTRALFAQSELLRVC